MPQQSIVVENLSKRYLIGHRVASREKWSTLRDLVSRELHNFMRKAADVVRGRQVVQGDEIEEFWALKDVGFEVKRGEVLGIVGRNGAGKSTLLKLLSRITEPTAGRIVLNGRVSSLLEVGTGFHPELTGRENIYLNGAILGMTQREIRTRFDEIVAFSELEKFLDTPVKQYSSGMYVRLAFAVAAHLEPEILIVDEVLAVGDAAFQQKCLGKLNAVAHKDGRTVLFVSHNISAVEHLCNRAILIEGGRIVSDGRPADVARQYASRVGTVQQGSLRDWTDRTTNGEAMITDLKVYDKTGVEISSVEFGRTVRFRIRIELRRPVRRAVVGITVHSTTGEQILDLRSSHNGETFDCNGEPLTVDASVERICLYPGSYTLSPYIYDRVTGIDLDWPQHCRSLNVIPASGSDGDLKLDAKDGKYFVPSSWTAHETSIERMADASS